MGVSPIKRTNSKSKNFADTAKETDTEKCDHNFSIIGYAAEVREKNSRKCWPFSEKSASLADKNIDSRPLPVPKSRFWDCKKCIKDIEADERKDKPMPEEQPSHLASPTVVYQEEESNAGNEGDENEDVNIERSQNDNRRVTRSQKKVHPQSMEASTSVRSKSRKLAKPAQRSKVNKTPTDTGMSREKQNVDQLAVTIVAPTEVAVAGTTVAPSEVAVVVEDTLPPEVVLLESDNLSSESLSPLTSGLPRRKTCKVRLMKDLLDDKSETKASGGSKTTRKEESSSQKESVGQKRKAEHYCYVRRKSRKAGATTENASKSIDADQAERVQEGVVRENDVDPGESVLPTPVESLLKEKDSVPSHLRPKRTARKSVIYNNKSNQIIMSGSGTDEGNQVTPPAGPSINASSQPTEDLPSEKRVGTLLDDELASEGYFRKHVPQVNDEPDNDHMRSSDAQANCVTRELGSSSKSNTGRWLTTGVDAVDFSSNNNTSSSTKVVDQASVPQKDASGADRKGKAIMVQDQNENTPKEQNDSILDKEEDVSNKEPQKTPLLLFDLNEPYDDRTSLEENDTSRAPETCDTNTARKEDYFPRSRPSPFSGHNSQRLGIVPTMGNQLHPSPSSHRLLHACSTGQNVPHQAPTRPIWTSPMIPPQCHLNPVPFNMDHSTRRGMRSQAPSNENTRNLNFVGANGNQRCGPNSQFSIFGYKHGDSSMALNRLSRMDPRLRSNTPADQHMNTRRQFTPVSQPKESVQLQAGDSSKTPYQPKQLTLDPYSNRFAPESSRRSFPTAPPIGTPSFPFQTAQASWSRHQKEINTQITEAIAPVNSSLARPVFPSSVRQGRSFQLLGSLSSMKLPLNSHLKEKEVKQKRKAESCSNASASPPMNSTSEFGPCNLNRNPADFTIPEPGSVYMLTRKDLRGGKRGPYKKKGSSGKQVGPVAESG